MDALLAMLKIDLGLTTDVYNPRLMQLLEAAKREILREGAVLDLSRMEDAQLCVMYAAYLWRQRDTMGAMPRMLRYALNNHVFGEAAKNAAGGDST